MKYLKLAQQLKQMAWVDQATIFARKPFAPVRDKHCVEMKRIVRIYGWPTPAKVGKLASNDAWLLVQHCDRDTAFQRRCLRLMKAEAKRGAVRRKNIALLEDRVRMNAEKPQMYGTQVVGNFKNVRPYKIWKPEYVDERRKQMGLIPLREYLKFIRKANRQWGGKKPKPNGPCPCLLKKKWKECHGG